jgi:dipeptidyl aminopeptidase/acylaminoacyl peptidase
MKKISTLLLMLILTACTATPTPASFFDALTPPPNPDLAPAAAPQADATSAANQPALPVITASAPGGDKERAGDLYFFLQPRQGGGSIELVHVSGICIVDSVNCPPLEKIHVPFALNFTINALDWSPDGKHAAFAYPDNANGTPQKLFLFDPAVKTWTAIAEFPYIDPPFWSPDGNLIAFRAQDGSGGESVYVIRRDGKDLKNISANLPAADRPYIMDGWYADNIIMRPVLPGSAGSIYLIRAGDGTARPLFASALTKAQFIASPDASLFVYDDYDRNTQRHILRSIQPDGANPMTLAEFTGGSLYPIVWSPDGNFIAFNYSSAGVAPVAEVYVVSRAGDKISVVYQGATVGRLIFSPNGKYLLVEETTSISGGHLFIIDLATLEKKILQAPGLSTDYDWYAPSWKP